MINVPANPISTSILSRKWTTHALFVPFTTSVGPSQVVGTLWSSGLYGNDPRASIERDKIPRGTINLAFLCAASWCAVREWMGSLRLVRRNWRTEISWNGVWDLWATDTKPIFVDEGSAPIRKILIYYLRLCGSLWRLVGGLRFSAWCRCIGWTRVRGCLSRERCPTL